jgi:hypothetical protein
MGIKMVDFESQYKKYEMVIERLKQVNEFWINSVLSTAKEFFKVK